MATYKFSGDIRDARDTQLWKEMLDKERGIQKEHTDYYNTDGFANVHSTSFGKSQFARSHSNDRTLKMVKENKLSAT